VFGEAVPLGLSVATQLVHGLPWVGAVCVAWWAAGRWPITRRDVLRPITFHAWVGMAVVVGQQLLLAGLRVAVVPPGLGPLDPWEALPRELTYRGPPALLVYAALVAATLVWRAEDPPDRQDVPRAGRGATDSS
jgi:hypothetical protein